MSIRTSAASRRDPLTRFIILRQPIDPLADRAMRRFAWGTNEDAPAMRVEIACGRLDPAVLTARKTELRSRPYTRWS